MMQMVPFAYSVVGIRELQNRPAFEMLTNIPPGTQWVGCEVRGTDVWMVCLAPASPMTDYAPAPATIALPNMIDVVVDIVDEGYPVRLGAQYLGRFNAYGTNKYLFVTPLKPEQQESSLATAIQTVRYHLKQADRYGGQISLMEVGSLDQVNAFHSTQLEIKHAVDALAKAVEEHCQ
jgi:hypothetical protein